MRFAILVSLVFLSFSDKLYAEEVDSFLDRDQVLNLNDASERINGLVQQLFEQIAHDRNTDTTKACNLELLKKRVSRDFGNVLFPRIKSLILKDTQMPLWRQRTDRAMTIYKNLSGMPGTCCSPSFRVGHYLVGVDKIDHFFSHGLELLGSSHLTAVEKSSKQEQGLFGYVTTGVYSYSDITANLDGLVFWESFLKKNSPFWKCEKNKMVLQKKFQIQDYLWMGWDEGYNCSLFRRGREIPGLKCPIVKMTEIDKKIPSIWLKEKNILSLLLSKKTKEELGLK